MTQGYAGPLLTFTPPAPYVLEDLSPPSPYDDEPRFTYRFTTGQPADDTIVVELGDDPEVVLCQQVDPQYPPCRQLPAPTGTLYEDSSDYYWVRGDGEVDVTTHDADEATVRALLASGEPATLDDHAELSG